MAITKLFYCFVSFLDKTFAKWIVTTNVLVGFFYKEDLQEGFILKILTNYLQNFYLQLVLFTVLFQVFCCGFQIEGVITNEMFSPRYERLCFVRNTFLKDYKETLSTWGGYLLFFLARYSQWKLAQQRSFAAFACRITSQNNWVVNLL